MRIASVGEPMSRLQSRRGDLVGRRPHSVWVLPERPDPLQFKIFYEGCRSITVKPRGWEVIRRLGRKVLVRIAGEVVEEMWPRDPEPPTRTEVQLAKQNATKKCRRCGQVLYLTAFSPDRTKRDRRKAWCRRCVAHWTRDRRRQRRAWRDG